MTMRIIGGALKGKRLRSVGTYKIRPTADRLRESIFNILSFRVQGAIVLDLFSGTGALGIEALSRGAQFTVFIDNYKSAIFLIEQNIRSCFFEHMVKIIKWDITKNLKCIKSFRPAFNLVFMDPPYSRNALAPTLKNLHASDSLEKGACIVIEHAADELISPKFKGYTITDQRKYGKTLVSFLNYML